MWNDRDNAQMLVLDLETERALQTTGSALAAGVSPLLTVNPVIGHNSQDSFCQTGTTYIPCCCGTTLPQETSTCTCHPDAC